MSGFQYIMSAADYREKLQMFGSKENIIAFINETYSLFRIVTDIKIVG